MTLFERIKLKAKEQGISIAELEKQLNFARSSIRKWDTNTPSLDKIIATSNFLQTSISWLATGVAEVDYDKDDGILKKYKMLSAKDKDRINTYIDIALLDSEYKEQEKNTSINENQERYNIIEKDLSLYENNKPVYEPSKIYSLPVLGKVAAGIPITGISIPLGYLEKPNNINPDYVLIATGDSMEPVINDGEYIYVKHTDSLNPGDIGIFNIDGEVTCKKYFINNDLLTLKSLNKKYSPFKYSLNECEKIQIQGKVLLTEEQIERSN